MQVAAKEAAGDAGSAAAAAPVDIMPLIAAADPAEGQKVFGKCKACHNADKGGANQVGPNLWNVVGGPHAHSATFTYSSVMAGMHDKTWNYEELNAFLTSPKTYAPGTRIQPLPVSASRRTAPLSSLSCAVSPIHRCRFRDRPQHIR